MDDDSQFDCPSSVYETLLSMWSNSTDPQAWHGDQYLYQTYVCHFATYWSFKTTCAKMEGYSVLSFGVLGFFGALCTALTLSQGPFRQIDFQLFRTVAYLEMLQMADVTAMTALAYFRCEYYYTCAFVWAHVATTTANVCSDAVDLIVLYLSIERTVACLLPHHFQTLHRLHRYHIVEILCLAFPVIFSLFQAFELTVFYDEYEERYSEEPSSFSQTDFYAGLVLINTIRFYITAVCILIATSSSIIGFLSVEKRRNKLKTSIVNESNRRIEQTVICQQTPQIESTSRSRNRFFINFIRKKPNVPRQQRLESTSSSVPNLQMTVPRANKQHTNRHKRQTDLCSLQLCLAIPVVINLILYAMGLTTSNYSFVTGKMVFEQNITYENAIKEIDLARTFQYLRTSTNISNVLSHSLHFYLYLLFSVKVRQGFMNLLKTCLRCRCASFLSRKKSDDTGRRRSTVGTIINGTATTTGNLNCERTHLVNNLVINNEKKSTAHSISFSN